MTNVDPAVGARPRTSIMALLGALAATGGGRRGCVLRVAANAITFYCGGGGGGHGLGHVGGVGGRVDSVVPDAGTDDDGADGGTGDHYARATAAGRLDGVHGRFGDYLRPIRSVASGGYYPDADRNDSASATATVLANLTASLEPFLNGSYNHTGDNENAENLTNYVFVITIGIILGAMILTTICGESSALTATEPHVKYVKFWAS